MFRHRHDEPDVVVPDREALRLEADHDAVVEQAAQRLRSELSDLRAFDRWGRPVAWRQVARIALGALANPQDRTPPKPRSVSPEGTERAAQWRAVFTSSQEADRLLRKETSPRPE